MSKTERRYNLIRRLEEAGFTYGEAQALRRIEMTLSRWSEHECTGNIQREGADSDGRPRWYSDCSIQHDTNPRGYIIPDRERGALKRLDKIMASHPTLRSYYQSDPRGCALYIVALDDLKGQDINSVYTRGIAVCD